MSIFSLGDFNGVGPPVGSVLVGTDTVSGRRPLRVDQVTEVETFVGHWWGLSHGHGHLLWCRAGLDIRTKKGDERLPAFTPGSLRDARLHGFYDRAGLQDLADVQGHELFGVTRLLRIGFTHGRRGHFETGGERLTSYETDAGRVVVEGGTPEMQINLAVGLFALVVRPTLAAARRLLAVEVPS